jgi:hypothetical protein
VSACRRRAAAMMLTRILPFFDPAVMPLDADDFTGN